MYHHTSSSTMNYALLEALLLIEEEGLQNRFERHLANHRALVAGVETMGLEMLVKPEHRLPTLNTIRVPDGVDEAGVRGYLLKTFNLEIGAGLGALAGQVWRVGLMGYASSAENVLFFLSAISRALAIQGYKTDLSAGQDAAMSLLNA
jgi:alanine-glyoxylate transaminase/serine-glyoxylate transaminase/serine-pyruvate transaminase